MLWVHKATANPHPCPCHTAVKDPVKIQTPWPGSQSLVPQRPGRGFIRAKLAGPRAEPMSVWEVGTAASRDGELPFSSAHLCMVQTQAACGQGLGRLKTNQKIWTVIWKFPILKYRFNVLKIPCNQIIHVYGQDPLSWQFCISALTVLPTPRATDSIPCFLSTLMGHLEKCHIKQRLNAKETCYHSQSRNLTQTKNNSNK